ncbi:MAG: hypothetical protein AAGD35_11440 [Actinomycetota bacterium]
MRERRPHDWETDLSQRHRLENAVANAIENEPRLTLIERRTDSLDQADFVVATELVPRAEVELKAKWQRSPTWRRFLPGTAERDLFILDERALRHLLTAAPDAHLLILDYPNRRWVVFDTAQLALVNKGRTSRPIARQRQVMKGKVILDLRGGYQAGSHITKAIPKLTDHIDGTHRNWSQIEAWPHPDTG